METEDFYKQIPVIIYPTGEPPITDLTKFSIPFSSFSEVEKTEYIYFGSEKMSFKDRHPEYRRILIYEFLTE
ncbi:MAG: hypothetical protein ACFE9Z_09565 [Promethearchaeota archaeon]